MHSPAPSDRQLSRGSAQSTRPAASRLLAATCLLTDWHTVAHEPPLIIAPAALGIAGSTLGEANCYRSRLLTQGLVGCSPNARVGFESATAIMPVASRTILEHANVEALMGEPAKDRIEILFYVEAESSVAGALVLPSVVREARAPYGEELATTVPAVEVWPGGPDLEFETFDSTLGPLGLTYHRRVGGHTIAYKPCGIRVPRACPPRGFPFRAPVTLADGAHESAVYHVPCPPR